MVKNVSNMFWVMLGNQNILKSTIRNSDCEKYLRLAVFTFLLYLLSCLFRASFENRCCRSWGKSMKFFYIIWIFYLINMKDLVKRHTRVQECKSAKKVNPKLYLVYTSIVSQWYLYLHILSNIHSLLVCLLSSILLLIRYILLNTNVALTAKWHHG